MRKIRNAALVAALLGSFSMFGAGVAAASDSDAKGGDGKGGKGGNVVVCEQESRVGDDIFQLGLVNIVTGPITVLGSGPATAVAVQQTCSGEDTVAGNSAAAETGTGLDLGLGLL